MARAVILRTRVLAYVGIVTSFNSMQSSACSATGGEDAAVLALASLFLLYSVADLLIHSAVFARRLS